MSKLVTFSIGSDTQIALDPARIESITGVEGDGEYDLRMHSGDSLTIAYPHSFTDLVAYIEESRKMPDQR